MSKATDIIAGLRPLELHYFRVSRERWELMLTRLHQMGADAVSTIIPWSWHEPRDGVFDLTGLTHPARDVADFVETCAAMGFRVVLRTGPYVGAGLLGGGVPGWLTREHPEIQALDLDAQPQRDPASGAPLPSAEHPTYLKHLERWYRELTNALASQQWPDGPIVALRVDSPTSGVPTSPARWDYNLHVTKVQWTIWLRRQYDGIDALNAAWGTDYRSFSDATFPRPSPAGELSPRDADAARFVACAAAHAAETYARTLREMGWTIPILTHPNELSPTLPVELAHAVQVDPEPPEVGANVRWAMDAPLRADGHPDRRFWSVKAILLGMEQGVKQVAGGILVTGAESRRVRLPRPADGYALYRLLLDGRLLDIASRTRGDKLYLNYVAADEAGETDVFILLNDPSAPLAGLLREYLTSLLMGKAQTLRRAGEMCRALAEALASAEPLAGEGPSPTVEDLRIAERSLAEARLAARRAAASLGRLERLASEVRGEPAISPPSLADLSALTSQEWEHLIPVRDACAQAAPALAEAIRAIAETAEGALTIQGYRRAFEGAQAAAEEAEALLVRALGSLRADLVAGTLPPSAWPLHDWLTRILRGLVAGL